MDHSDQLWKLMQIVTPAMIGFAGVCVGAGITWLREYLAGRHKKKSDAAYLAAIVGGTLDSFISGCSEVVGDNGQVDKSGDRHAQTTLPKFDPSLLDVEWSSIPPELLFDIQDMPYQLMSAAGAISAAGEYAAMPPDYEEIFEERQYQFAKLGLHGLNIAERLRAFAKLSPRAKVYQWDPKTYFEQKIEDVEARRTTPASLPDLGIEPTGNDRAS